LFDWRVVETNPLRTHGYALTTREGFGALYDLALPQVFRSMMRLTGGNRAQSEDLTQEAFGELVRAISDGTLTHADVGWLMVTARRRYLDSVRRWSLEERKLRLLSGGATEQDTLEPVWGSIDGGRMLALLGRLPADQRSALVLRHVDGCSVPEVASELDRSLHATESLLARARRNLRDLVQEDGHVR
jgi:RNA polymerase sigma-70 factor, ECF subfamily